MVTLNQQTPFIPLMEELIGQIASGQILKKKGGRYTANSIGNFENNLNHIKEYQNKIGTIYAEDLNENWANDFLLYLMEKNLAQNSMANIINIFKSALKKLSRKKCCSYDGSGIHVKEESTVQVYTSVKELDHLYYLDLSKTPGLEYVRDLYIMQANIGLRWSDFMKFIANIPQYIKYYDGKPFIEIETQKKLITVVIPVASIVAEIIEKYKAVFRKISQQYFSKSIKNVCKKAEFTQQIMKMQTRKGIKVYTLKPKYALINNHTARRSFVTNLYLAGVDILTIMQMTGHRDINTLMKYIRATGLESAKKVVENELFKRRHIKREIPPLLDLVA